MRFTNGRQPVYCVCVCVCVRVERERERQTVSLRDPKKKEGWVRCVTQKKTIKRKQNALNRVEKPMGLTALLLEERTLKK